MLKKLSSQENFPILQDAKRARFQPPLFAQLGIFILVFICSQIIQSIVVGIGMLPSLFQNIIPEMLSDEGVEQNFSLSEFMKSTSDKDTLIMLFSTIFMIVLVLIYCRKIEKRTYASMGFSKSKFAVHYLWGLFAGAVLFTVTVLICMLFGAIRFEVSNKISVGYVILFFIAFLIQGASEEIMCRGYFMVSLSNRSSVVFAVFASSFMFSLFHVFNANVTFLGLFNIFLFGVFASLYMLLFNNIWGICALHSSWNFVQGNIFGSNTSGLAIDNRVLEMICSDKYELLNGGAFGIEGGLAMTIVLGIVIIIFTCLLFKRIHSTKLIGNEQDNIT